MAIRFASEGARVVITGRRADALDSAAGEVREAGGALERRGLNVRTWEVAYGDVIQASFVEARRARGEDADGWWAALSREGRDNAVAVERGRVLGYASWVLEEVRLELDLGVDRLAPGR